MEDGGRTLEMRAKSLKEMPVDAVGSPQWMAQHVNVQKMNFEAHQCARDQRHNYILEALVTFDKMGLLVHELLVCEAWRANVYPRIKDHVAHTCSIRAYYALYHEATLCNLLECLLYHDYAAEALGECASELVDFCARKIAFLVAEGPRYVKALCAGMEVDSSTSAADGATAKHTVELDRQADDVSFRSCVSCVVILRFLTEHVSKLPLGAASRMLDTHDVLLLMIPLIENPPWTRRRRRRMARKPAQVPSSEDDANTHAVSPRAADHSGEGAVRMVWEKLIDHEWCEVDPHDLLELTNLEGQPWLILYNLMCDTDCRRRYHLNCHRKDTILRARKYLNGVILDQLPVLAQVQRYLDELVVLEAPHAPAMGPSLVLEQVPVIYDSLNRRPSSQWDALAMALTTVPNGVAVGECGAWFAMQDLPDDPSLLALADLYGMDEVEALLGPGGARQGMRERTAPVVNVTLSAGAKDRCAFDFCISELEPTQQQTSHGLFERFQLCLTNNAAQGHAGEVGEQSSKRLPNDKHIDKHIRARILFANGSVEQLCTEEPVGLPITSPASSLGNGTHPSKWVKLGSLAGNSVVQIQLVHSQQSENQKSGGAWAFRNVFLSLRTR